MQRAGGSGLAIRGALRQNTAVYGQAPEAAAAPAPSAGFDLLQNLELLGWVDRSALAVLLVFFVIGLFKGLFWQVSRIGILLIAYVIAGRFGGDVGRWISRDELAAAAHPAPHDTTLYLAYLAVFLVVVVVLSLIAIQLQKLVKKSGLTFFDRIGGGVFGVATGACTVLFLLFVVNMFFRDSGLGQDAEASHSLRLSRRAIDWLGGRVPDELRHALELAPLSAAGDGGAPPPEGQPEPEPGRQPDQPPRKH